MNELNSVLSVLVKNGAEDDSISQRADTCSCCMCRLNVKKRYQRRIPPFRKSQNSYSETIKTRWRALTETGIDPIEMKRIVMSGVENAMHSNRKITFNNTMFGKIIQLNHAFPAGTEGETCYSTDRLETRGVFRGFFAKNPSFTAKIPSRSDLEWDFRKLQYTPSIGRVL